MSSILVYLHKWILVSVSELWILFTIIFFYNNGNVFYQQECLHSIVLQMPTPFISFEEKWTRIDKREREKRERGREKLSNYVNWRKNDQEKKLRSNLVNERKNASAAILFLKNTALKNTYTCAYEYTYISR